MHTPLIKTQCGNTLGQFYFSNMVRRDIKAMAR